MTAVQLFDPNSFFGAVGLIFISAILAFLATWYWFQRNQSVKERDRLATEHAKLAARVAEIELQSHVLTQAMLPISAAFQAILVKELTHMHTPEMDFLLAKLGPPFILTEVEADRLGALLDARTRDMDAEITPSERDAARMMPALMRRVRREIEDRNSRPEKPPILISMTAVVDNVDGTRSAVLVPLQVKGIPPTQSVLASAVEENTRMTREVHAWLQSRTKRSTDTINAGIINEKPH